MSTSSPQFPSWTTTDWRQVSDPHRKQENSRLRRQAEFQDVCGTRCIRSLLDWLTAESCTHRRAESEFGSSRTSRNAVTCLGKGKVNVTFRMCILTLLDPFSSPHRRSH